MIIYLFTTDLFLEEASLIREFCSWQNQSLTYINPKYASYKQFNEYFKKYYKGNGPVVVFSKDFLDVKTNWPPVVKRGFFEFVDFYQKNFLLKC